MILLRIQMRILQKALWCLVWITHTEIGSTQQQGGILGLILEIFSEQNSVILGDGTWDRIRFVPDGEFTGVIENGITFRAWDQSDGFNSGKTGVNIFVTGGASPYSAEVGTASIQVGILGSEFNDPPTIDPIPDQGILEDTDLFEIDLTNITSGAIDENQVLTVTAQSSDEKLIPAPVVEYNSPELAGILKLTPNPDTVGSVMITVQVKDDGGTDGDGVDTTTFSFQVDISSVNDAPTYTKGSDFISLGRRWSGADQSMGVGNVNRSTE